VRGSIGDWLKKTGDNILAEKGDFMFNTEKG